MEQLEAVDAHHHLWDLEENSYPWLTPDPETDPFPNFSDLCQSYRLADFRADAAHQSIVKSVHVQAEHDESDPVRETAWLQGVADAEGSGGFPHAIVAWADLSRPAAEVEALLEAHSAHANVRGIRQMLNQAPDAASAEPGEGGLGRHGDLLTNPSWLAHFGLLRRHDLSFDMQLFPHQTASATRLVAAHADTQFILNHTLMPFDRSEAGLAVWRDALECYAGFPNVVIKISGLGMAPGGWDESQARRLASETIEVFGPDRCLFASNFPVDRLMADYDTIWSCFRAVIAEYSRDEQSALLRGNAERVYRI